MNDSGGQRGANGVNVNDAQGLKAAGNKAFASGDLDQAFAVSSRCARTSKTGCTDVVLQPVQEECGRAQPGQ